MYIASILFLFLKMERVKKCFRIWVDNMKLTKLCKKSNDFIIRIKSKSHKSTFLAIELNFFLFTKRTSLNKQIPI